MKKEKLTAPFDLVAKALECSKDSLTEESAMVNHPKWDSLSHVCIIDAMETEYGVQIKDEEVMLFDNMKSIIRLYNRKISEL